MKKKRGRCAKDLLGRMPSGEHAITQDAQALLASAGLRIGGEYVEYINGVEVGRHHNMWTAQGLRYALMTAFLNGDRAGAFYVALWGGNYTPAKTIKAAEFAANAGEIVSTEEGYTAATRALWTPSQPQDAAADGSALVNTGAEFDRVQINAQTPAIFTFKTADEVIVRGAALLTTPQRGSTQGELLSIAKFRKERRFQDGDEYALSYRMYIA